MKFIKLIAKNFMQYKNLDLSLDNKGLCLIQGEVEGHTFLDSNTSGKTTALVHTLCWCLFGKTFSGLSSDDIVNDIENKDCSVTVVVEINNTQYNIVRYRKHSVHKNELKLYRGDLDVSKSSNAETQKEIITVLGTDWDSFINTIIFGQGNIRRFTEYTDTERKHLLDKLLNLEILKTLQDKTKSHRSELERSILEITNDIKQHENALSLHQTNLQKYEHESNMFASNIELRVSQLNKNLEELKGKEQDLKSKDITNPQELLNKVSIVEQGLIIKEEAIEGEYDAIAALDKKIIQLEDKIYFLTTVIDSLNSKIASTDNDDRELCDSCGQFITEKSKLILVRKYESDVIDRSKEKEELTEKLSILKMEEQEIKKKYKIKKQEIKSKLKKYLDYKQELKSKIEGVASNNRLLEIISTQIKDKQNEIEREINKENPYVGLMESSKKDINKATNAINLLKEKLNSCKNKLPYYIFWEQGFSNAGIKSLLLDNVVPYVTEKANYYLQFLTNGEIKVILETQCELKSKKELSDKLNIKLFKNGSEFCLEKSSGGERKRIDICISLALQSLLSSNRYSNITIFDEVFDSLDDTGTNYVLALLKNEIKYKDSIFVISHNPDLKDHFENILMIKKINGISSIN